MNKKKEKTDKLIKIHERLSQTYVPNHHSNKEKIFDEILYIFFTWRTPIKKAEEIFQDLYFKYPNKTEWFALNEENWYSILESGGKARDKSRAVVKLLSKLKQDFKDIDSIESMGKWEDETIHRYLISLPGIKDKSAYCIMLYAMHKPYFPTDAHCLRICQRVGLIKGTSMRKQDREKGQKELNELLAGNYKICYDLHTTMIVHGRTVCKSRPLCGKCVIEKYCEYSKSE